MSTLYCGLDAGSTSSHLAALNEDGEELENIGFATGEQTLLDAFSVLGDRSLKVHLEASELAEWLRGVMQEKIDRVEKVAVSHPQSMRWISHDPQKGDPLDARKLAELLRLGRTHEVYYSDEAGRVAFRKVTGHYDEMTDQQRRLKQKIKARLRREGVITEGTDVYSEEGRQEALKEISPETVRVTVQRLYRALDHATALQEEAREMMLQEASKYDEIARFREVPGIGPILACRFSAYIQNPHRFANKRKLWRYCGLAVTRRTSDGKPVGREKLDPNGHPQLKALSRQGYMGAMRTQSDNAFKRAKRRYLRKGGRKTHARLKVQRKVVTTLWTLWKKGERYDDSKG
jgi:transposase